MPLEDIMENDDSGFGQPPPPDWRRDNVEYQAFARFARMTEECRELEARAKEMRRQLEDMSYQLRDYLGSKGYKNVEVGGYKIYLQPDIYVRAREGMNQEIICDVLKRNGLGHFVKEQYSTQSLTGHVKGLKERHAEELKNGRIQSVQELLPAEVVAVLDMDPRFNVVARRQGARRAMLTIPQPEQPKEPLEPRYVNPRGPLRPRI